MKILVDKEKLEAIQYNLLHYRYDEATDIITYILKSKNLLIKEDADESNPELTSPQIAEFLYELADTIAAYFYNCRKDSKEALQHAIDLDKLMERLKEYRQ